MNIFLFYFIFARYTYHFYQLLLTSEFLNEPVIPAFFDSKSNIEHQAIKIVEKVFLFHFKFFQYSTTLNS